MDDAAVARSLGDKGAIVSGEGVVPSREGGSRRRERRAWRGGRMSKSCGGGSVEEGGGDVAVGMMCTAEVDAGGVERGVFVELRIGNKLLRELLKDDYC